MAKKIRTKKKVKKNVANGVVHIQSTFNNTIVTITDTVGNVVACQAQAFRDLRGRAKARLLLHNSRLRMLQKRLWNMACEVWKYTSKGPVRDENLN